MNERRYERRHQLTEKIAIFDEIKSEPIGHLVNIHQHGLMVFGPPLTLHASYQIELHLPNAVHAQYTVNLGIECLWQQPIDHQANMYWSGCSIIDKSAFAETCIETLIKLQTPS